VLFITACAHKAPLQKLDTTPPLLAVAHLITQGMTMMEVETKMAGNKPALKYSSSNNYHIWEFRERTDRSKDITEAKRLLIKFDNQGKVSYTSNVEDCIFPDLPPTKSNEQVLTHCYQKLKFPFDKKVTFDAIKRLLIVSNYQIEHTDASSEVISATGMQNIPDDKNKAMYVKLSIMYSAGENDSSEVVMSANFSITEKHPEWVQAGFAGVTLPVPLPFQKKEEWVDTGHVSPKFYLIFFDALNNLIANEFLPYAYSPSAVPPTPVRVNVEAPIPPPPSLKVKLPIDAIGQQVPTEANDALLDSLKVDKRPIDTVLKEGVKKPVKVPIDAPQADSSNADETSKETDNTDNQDVEVTDDRPIDQVLLDEGKHKKSAKSKSRSRHH
jgi:ribosomal protein L12E/L44/L45/RPP1/RPP2